MSTKSSVVGAVEIGSTTIKVVVGKWKGGELSILGHAERPSRGVRCGAISDFGAASEATHSTLRAAENNADVLIPRLNLALTARYQDGLYNEAAIELARSKNSVTPDVIDQVCRGAKSQILPKGHRVLHHLRRPFRLDGSLVSDPEHLVGQRLEVGYWIVHCENAAIATSTHVVTSFGIPAPELILASLASGRMTTSTEDRQKGVLVIDIGGGTTDFVLYRDGCAYMTGVIPLGGRPLTDDLATEFTLDIIHILAVVKIKLADVFTPEACAAGVVLTGGASKQPGIVETATDVFGVPARLGEPPLWANGQLRDPSYSTVLGLFHF